MELGPIFLKRGGVHLGKEGYLKSSKIRNFEQNFMTFLKYFMASLSGKFVDRKPRNPPRCNIRRKKEKTLSSINNIE